MNESRTGRLPNIGNCLSGTVFAGGRAPFPHEGGVPPPAPAQFQSVAIRPRPARQASGGRGQ